MDGQRRARLARIEDKYAILADAAHDGVTVVHHAGGAAALPPFSRVMMYSDRLRLTSRAVYSTLMFRSLVTLPQKATCLLMNCPNSAGESLVICCALTLLY